MRESSTDKAIFCGSEAKPGAISSTTQGMQNSIRITKRVRKKVRTEMAWEAKRMDSSRPSVTSLWDNMGTKAVVKAPSANRLRNRFGSLKATKKASDTAPAPRKLARIISRANPVMRLTSVNPPKVAIDLNKDIFFPLNCYLLRIFC